MQNGDSNGHINGGINGHINGESNGHISSKRLKANLANSRHISTNGPAHSGVSIPAANGQEAHKTKMTPSVFLEEFSKMIIDNAVEQKRESKVLDFAYPKEMAQRFDLSLSEDGKDDDELIDICKQVIKHSVKTNHPHFFNQLFAKANHYGVAGSWLIDTLNTSQYTYEMAPLFTLIENTVLSMMRTMIGYEGGDGILCPGGSINNMYAMHLARYYKYPELKTKGLHAVPELCIFVSEQCHYSIDKGAFFLGIGLDNVIKVKSDPQGRMSIPNLHQCIEEARSRGLTPFIVVGTAGTTVLGAFDPLDDIATVCEQHGMWLHVDACLGGGVIFSEKHKSLLHGINRSDSVTWNPHKMLGVPQQCSIFLTKHQDLLSACFSTNAGYLFQKDKFYDLSYDTGDKSLQCGRKVDAFKFWLILKAKGLKGIEKNVDNAFDNRDHLVERLQQEEGFRLVKENPMCTNVCFWYIPPRLRGQEETEEWWQDVAKVAPVIKQRMMSQGTMMCGYQNHGNLPNFWRMVILNEDCNHGDMDFVVDEIARLGIDL